MKKRKRKMEENKVECLKGAFLISSSLLILIINSLFITAQLNTIALCQPITTHFDEEHHRLNLSQSNSSQNGNIMQTEINPIFLLNNPNKSQVDQVNSSDSSLISQQLQQQHASKSEVLNDNSLDNDLLAVESNRSLDVAATQKSKAQPPTRDQQTNPPYASNISTSSSASSHYARLNSSFSQPASTTLQPLNDTHLLKLHRATNPPSFVREHQQHRTTSVGSDIFQTKSHFTHQLTNNNSYTSGLKYSAQQTSGHQQASNVLLPITSSWHSLYYSPSTVAKQTGRQPVIHPSSNFQPASTSDHRLREDVKNFTQQSDNYLKPNASSSTIVSNQIEQESATNISESSQGLAKPSSLNNFPSLLSLNVDELKEEQLERTLAIGNYQRTNARNMSWSQLLRQATESNVMESLMVTNKSIVSLLCDTNDMLIRFKFKQPFRGSVMTNLDRKKSCRLFGTGGYYYEMRISLNDCGTRQEMHRVFINNILIEFNDSSSKSAFPTNNQHPNLDIAENEIKTIICSYPIKPRAPPPPDLPIGLSERIVEQAAAPSEPARLVYYEPLVLISGLLFLSLTFLGLTVSAYMFAKRFRGGSRLNLSSRNNLSTDNTRAGGFTTSRIYRNSPAQMANFLLAPPLIGSEDDINKTKRLNPTIPQTTFVKKYKTIPDRRRGGGEASNVKRYLNDRFGREDVTLTKIGTKDDEFRYGDKRVAKNGFSTVNLNPNDSPDSLADKNDKSSITTIAIPFSTKTKSRSEHVNSLDKFVGSRIKLAANSSSDSSEQSQVNISSRQRDAEASFRKGDKPISPPPLPPQSKSKSKSETKMEEKERQESDNKIDNQTTFSRSTKKSRYYKSERVTKTEYPSVDSKEVQAGGDTPPFGSLRSRLTSPREFKRLQEITRMFEEVIVEKPSAGNDGATVAHKIDLKPSKYKSKILNNVEESERRFLANMLAKDELFRSLVVDSTNRDTFIRKLKESSTYGKRFSESTWKLLEEILLDPDITSGVDSNSIINHIDSSSHSETENLRDGKRIVSPSSNRNDTKQHLVLSQQQLIEKREEDSHESVYIEEYKSDNQVKLSEKGDDKNGHDASTDDNDDGDDESVLVEIDAHYSDSQRIERDDSLNSNGSNIKGQASILTKSPKRSAKLVARSTTPTNKVQHKDTVRVSQFNSTTKEGGMTGTLINIDSVTNFTSSKDFSTYTKSRIEHTRYEAQDDSLPLFDQSEKIGSYDYAKETFKLSPKLSSNTFNRRMLKRPPLRKFSDE